MLMKRRTILLSLREIIARNSILLSYIRPYTLFTQPSLNMSGTELVGNKSSLLPPSDVRGMLILEKDRFCKTISVPVIEIDENAVRAAIKKGPISKYYLKINNFKPIQRIEEVEKAKLSLGEVSLKPDSRRIVVLNPDMIQSFDDISKKDRESLKSFGITAQNAHNVHLTLSYEHWRADEILKAILPVDKEGVASYSKVGHIIHLNLRDHFEAYKQIIGQVLLDKISGARTIVNKLDVIDNTYRNFQMEVLCGDNDMMAQVRENYCIFEFDFSTVYWNPRLSTEHERIVKKIDSGDILYDVFAGVGPFTIPVAKKNCTVLANDLNPESYRWLNHNAKLNKVGSLITTFNKDGAEFIKEDVKKDMLERWVSGKYIYNYMHITMNLPALAETFTNTFFGLFSLEEIESIEIINYPIVHLYCFTKGDDPKTLAKEKVETHLGVELTDGVLKEIFFVRNVSPQKEMMRVSFVLSRDILLGRQTESVERCKDGPPLKKMRTFENANCTLEDGEEEAKQLPGKEEKQ